MDHREEREQGSADATPRGSAVNHAGLTVSDLAASVSFYRDVVGMEVEPMGTVQTGGDWFDTLTWNSGAAIDVAQLRLGATTLQARPIPGALHHRTQSRRQRPSVHHRPEVEVIHREVIASGRYRPTTIVDIPRTGIRSFYVEDPDGVPVELLQPPVRPIGGHQPDPGTDDGGMPE